MTITIDIDPHEGLWWRTGFSATVKVGDQEAALGACYTEADALHGATWYVTDEYRRGKYSKFALFQDAAREAK